MHAEWDDGALVVRAAALPAVLAIVPTGALGLGLGPGLVPTAGSWERVDGAGHATDGVARFTPRFAPVPGTVFAVVGRADAQAEWIEVVRVSAPGARGVSSVVVETIDPVSEEVPENLLRVAVTFSAPMEEGSAAGRIHLRDADGADLAGALFPLPPELWDRDRRRLTVLLEPGRIKRGLQPNLQAGPPLREGDTVTLVVDAGIRDAAGAPLAEGASRSYRVGPAVRARIDPAEWDVRWPDARGDAPSPLTVRFGRPLDRALVRRHLRLIGGDGHPVAGEASLNADATEWTFRPAASPDAVARDGWRLEVDARLEDLAGNSVRRVFDRDLSRAADDGIEATVVVLTPDGRVSLRR